MSISFQDVFDIGFGYDATDPFVDDSEAVSKCLSMMHGLSKFWLDSSSKRWSLFKIKFLTT